MKSENTNYSHLYDASIINQFLLLVSLISRLFKFYQKD